MKNLLDDVQGSLWLTFLFLATMFAFSASWGCTTYRERYAEARAAERKAAVKALNSWVGSSVNELLRNWGAPTGQVELPNGYTVYEFLSDQGSRTELDCDPVFGGCSSRTSHNACKTSFIIDTTNKVEGWKREGNSCA